MSEPKCIKMRVKSKEQIEASLNKLYGHKHPGMNCQMYNLCGQIIDVETSDPLMHGVSFRCNFWHWHKDWLESVFNNRIKINTRRKY